MLRLQGIIDWCNNNVGFATVVLAIATVIVGVVAVVVSINTARMPYKKKILITYGGFIDTDGVSGIHVTATNIGNRQVGISTIGLQVKRKMIINTLTLANSQVILKQGEQTCQHIEREKLLKCFVNMGLSVHTVIYAAVNDNEGKIYRKRIGRLKKIVVE